MLGLEFCCLWWWLSLSHGKLCLKIAAISKEANEAQRNKSLCLWRSSSPSLYIRKYPIVRGDHPLQLQLNAIMHFHKGYSACTFVRIDPGTCSESTPLLKLLSQDFLDDTNQSVFRSFWLCDTSSCCSFMCYQNENVMVHMESMHLNRTCRFSG